ncbi:TetR family transcriptional regulator [Nocardia camponoti]|uniref:TetR family transcriptional regulator n=1 Tax=Nocardia camponoti TaxID=1616106 RepID=A0A917V556_9NOCA|nr:TetR family transcriptional regulator [Nocardia camponoti]GGK38205.1 TetR family transcriptional regulator [Nocardia camponoti]
MSDRPTRERILVVAMELFGAHGYHRTSVRAIAEQLGISKAGVLYHFPSKYDILAGLAEPLLEAMAATIDDAAEAAAADPVVARTRVLEGLLDVFIAHRYLLRLNVNDLALAAPGSIFDRFRNTMMAANRLVAGPRPTLPERVRAAQALGALSDPVVLYADEDVARLRAAVLSGLAALYPPATAPGSRGRGRPKTLDAEAISQAHAMSAAGCGADEIAAELGISRATVYRYLNLSLRD